MDIANLTAFIAVAETSSFSLAADRLFLTQPAISKRISTLEQSLNTKLFDRIGRNIQLTEAGKALLPHAYHILTEINDASRKLSNLETEVKGQLNIATSHHIGLHRLPPILRSFTKRYPKVNLNIHFLDSEKAYDAVLHGHVELAIITLAAATYAPLTAIPIWNDSLDFVCSQDNPLSQFKQIDLATLAKHPAIFPGLGTFTHDIIKNCFLQAKLTPNITMSTNYMETIKMLVSIGIAWSVLPSTMLDPSLIKLNVKDVTLSRQLGYLYHRERTLSKATIKLIELLKIC
ncbi:LysR family transcriptional regulator [Entomomonas asaccharolytica]|uniref:LysR family transcriptional regulator n=1 Tax=Entomomonas asaccharolytica TaxID=2785331 RepID=A0A974RWK4_9GAMM|nr:LysR family transcriptional regulator [Entomomonas asaccharolytica]QQP85237.1 LysR family transcriptional regulator [Entomomonas asaccharolytica]